MQHRSPYALSVTRLGCRSPRRRMATDKTGTSATPAIRMGSCPGTPMVNRRVMRCGVQDWRHFNARWRASRVLTGCRKNSAPEVPRRYSGRSLGNGYPSVAWFATEGSAFWVRKNRQTAGRIQTINNPWAAELAEPLGIVGGAVKPGCGFVALKRTVLSGFGRPAKQCGRLGGSEGLEIAHNVESLLDIRDGLATGNDYAGRKAHGVEQILGWGEGVAL